jgi:hypothetical protein
MEFVQILVKQDIVSVTLVTLVLIARKVKSQATHNGHHEIVSLLLQNGADVNLLASLGAS